MMAIRRAISEKLIGDVLRVDIAHGGRFSWPSDTRNYFVKENGGALLNMGIHYLDMVEFWVGPLVPGEYRDDCAGGTEANFQFDLIGLTGSPSVRIAVSFTHQLRNTIVVLGTRGRIESAVDVMDQCNWELNSGLGGTLKTRSDSRIEAEPYEFPFAFAEQFLEFADVASGQRQSYVDPAAARRTQQLIDWAERHRAPLARHPRRATRPGLSLGRAVVTGGTGFLGTRLVERLCELEFPTPVVPVRSYQSGAALGCFPAERRRIDLLRRKEVEALLEGSRYVFHLAYGNEGREAQKITVDGTKTVVEAAIACGVESVVIVITTAVFGHNTAVGEVDESSRVQARPRRLCKEQSDSRTVLPSSCAVLQSDEDRCDQPVFHLRSWIVAISRVPGSGCQLRTLLLVR